MDTTELDALDRADMQRLAGGEDRALNDLMDRHAGSMFRFLCRMLGNEDDAQDLAQETFVRVFQHRHTFKPDARFSTWLYTIAGNLARNHHRWRSRHPNISLDATMDDSNRPLSEQLPSRSPSPSAHASTAEKRQAVRNAVDRLPEDMREITVLCEWEELSMGDAAKVLGTTPKSVESKLYRARKLLRDALKDWL